MLGGNLSLVRVLFALFTSLLVVDSPFSVCLDFLPESEGISSPPPSLGPSNWSEDIQVSSVGASVFPDISVGPDGSLNFAWLGKFMIPLAIYYKKLDKWGSVVVDDKQLTNWTEQKPDHSSTDIGAPRIAVDHYGNSHIVWRDARNIHQGDIFYTMLDPLGNTLIDDTVLTESDGKQPRQASIDVDQYGNVHLVWLSDIFVGAGIEGIEYSKLDPTLDDMDGDSADRNQILVVNKKRLVTNRGSPDLAVDSNGNVHIVFVDHAPDAYVPKWPALLMLDDGGNLLMNRTPVSLDANYSDDPNLFVDSSNMVHVTWRDWRDALQGPIFYTKLDPYLDDLDGDEANLSIIKKLEDVNVSTNTGNFHHFPVILAKSDGNASVIWKENDELWRTEFLPDGSISVFREHLTTIQRMHAFGYPSFGDVDKYDRLFIVWDHSLYGTHQIFMKHTLEELPSENEPPVADAGPDQTANEGDTVQFNGSKSYDPDGDELEYRWDFENDGIWDTHWTSSPTVSHVYLDDFVGKVALEVREVGKYAVDQVNDKSITFVSNIGPYDRAQSFIPTKPTISALEVCLTLGSFPEPEPNAPIEIGIRESFDGPFLSAISIAADDVPRAWLNLSKGMTFLDISDIDVVQGETYYIVFGSNESGMGSFYVCGNYQGYPNGSFYMKFSGPQGWTETYHDVAFKTYSSVEGESEGLSDISFANVTIHNVPPIVEWTSESSDGTIVSPPYPEGKEILFKASVYDPGIYDTFTYDWDFGDGTVLLDAGPSVTHAYGDNDTYIVVLTVTDDDGGVGIDDTPPLLMTNENPIPSISLPLCIFFEGTTPCPMIGEFSDPGWLDTHSAVWDYGDGTYENAVLTEENDPPDATGWNITSHIYGDNGVYDITFTVVDDDGGVGTASAEAQVINLPPDVSLDAQEYVNEGEDFVLAITAMDPGSDDLTIQVDWGDGTSETETFYNNGIGPDPPNSGEGVYPFTVYTNLTHVYGDNGDFEIEVTIEDDDGDSVQEILTIRVLNLPPEINPLAVPTYVNEGEEFILVAEATDPGSDDIEFSWTFELGPSVSAIYYNDGTGPDPVLSPWGTFPFIAEDTVTHTYGDNGYYDVTITATDDDGGVVTSLVTIEVRNVEPSVDIGGPYAGDENSPIEFTATAVDPGSDDLTFIWDWGDGTTDAMVFYNDGVNIDPPKSPWGTYPFDVTHTVSHVWGDNGDFTVTLTVTDDDGGVTVQEIIVVVNNVAPTIEDVRYYLNASFAFRIAGEKWHNVEIHLYEDGSEVGYANITRYPGSPNDQMATLGDISIDFSKTYSAIAYYTPEDDPVNGQIWGATPAWIIIQYEDGEERIHHTFNVRHEDTWTWVIEDFSPYFIGHNITFVATASDPGSDDLTFTWNWGDGTSTEHIHYNDGVGPDPYPSPDVNPITATDTARHAYGASGPHTVTLTVTDDDGGFATFVLTLTI